MFDREPIKNVLSTCVFKPEIAVYLCDTRDATFFRESALYKLFSRRKMKTMPRFYYLDATNPGEIYEVLRAVVHDYPDAVFDFSGGRDLVLLMAGACFAEMDLPGYYVDIPRGRFINVRGCEELAPLFKTPDFSAEDIFTMAGATITGSGHFLPAQLSADFQADVLAVFPLVMQNTKAWGGFVSWLQAFCAGTSATTLEVEGPRGGHKGGGQANITLLRHLQKAGIITRLEIGKNYISLAFKSTVHRKSLMIEGIWLELYCYVVARQSGRFGDVRTSIVVDWAGVDGGVDNTKNEVDVFITKGVTPMFISCKMSVPSPLALSEIKMLSTKFGGWLSRTVVFTAARLGPEHRALKNRAAEMDVLLLDAADSPPDVLLAHLEKGMA
jgi:hypothetical protein